MAMLGWQWLCYKAKKPEANPVLLLSLFPLFLKLLLFFATRKPVVVGGGGVVGEVDNRGGAFFLFLWRCGSVLGAVPAGRWWGVSTRTGLPWEYQKKPILPPHSFG